MFLELSKTNWKNNVFNLYNNKYIISKNKFYFCQLILTKKK